MLTDLTQRVFFLENFPLNKSATDLVSNNAHLFVLTNFHNK